MIKLIEGQNEGTRERRCFSLVTDRRSATSSGPSNNLRIDPLDEKFRLITVTLKERDRQGRKRGRGVRTYDPGAGYELTIFEGDPHEP